MVLHRIASIRRVGIAALLGISVGCDGASPSAPSPNPPATALAILAIAPNTGSTGGGTVVRISGTGFQVGAVLTLNGETWAASVDSSAVMQFTAPAHGPGSVEVTITNPDRRTVSLAGGYSFAPPQSFDFNGTWAGLALAHPDADGRLGALHSDMELRFTIQGQLLSSLTCGDETLTISPPLPVRDGEFAFAGLDGVISGRIVSAVGALGTISTPGCPATRWSATKQ